MEPLRRELSLIGRLAAVLIVFSFVSYFVGVKSIFAGTCFLSAWPAFAPLAILIAAVAIGLLLAIALIRRSLRDWLIFGGLLVILGLAIFGLRVFRCVATA
jgi:4-amino-4-deoxy-L-arabinose transferase-like glycosyltransferase